MMPLEEMEEAQRRQNLQLVRISNSSEFRDLLNNNSKKEKVMDLIVNESCCNDMKEDLEISGFKKLETLIIKKNSLKNLKSIKI